MLYLGFKIGLLVSGALGLIAAVAFALHLCFIGKAKLCEQWGRKETPQADYGTVNQLHSTMYIEEKECLRHATSTLSESEENTDTIICIFNIEKN